MARRAGTIRGRIAGPAATLDPGPAGDFAADFGASGEAGLFRLVSAIPDMVASPKATFSMWFHMPNFGPVILLIVDPSNLVNSYLAIFIDSNRRISVSSQRSAGGNVVLFTGSNSVLATLNAWNHVLLAWDTTQDIAYGYLNNEDAWTDAVTNNVFIDENIEYTVDADNEVQIVGGDLIGAPLQDCMAQLWFDSNRFVDISVEANRRLFTAASGAPIALGPDGSNPTGFSPVIYLENPFDSIEINRGTGGDFSVFGSIGNCDDTPAEQF